ncbi:MAG: lipoprotein [Pseudomonadota bacterium]
MIWLALSVVMGASALAGCGQKGPLYIPDDAARSQGK